MSSFARWLLDSVPAIVAMASLVAAVSVAMASVRARAAGWRAGLVATFPDTLLLFALGTIGLLTLGSPAGPQPDRVNLLPFRDQLWAFQGRVEPVLAAAMVLGNVALFVPLGAALAIRFPADGSGRLVLLAAGVSLAVELLQAALNIGRLADVTDVLANTVGAVLGVALWRTMTHDGRSAWRA